MQRLVGGRKHLQGRVPGLHTHTHTHTNTLRKDLQGRVPGPGRLRYRLWSSPTLPSLVLAYTIGRTCKDGCPGSDSAYDKMPPWATMQMVSSGRCHACTPKPVAYVSPRLHYRQPTLCPGAY